MYSYFDKDIHMYRFDEIKYIILNKILRINKILNIVSNISTKHFLLNNLNVEIEI